MSKSSYERMAVFPSRDRSVLDKGESPPPILLSVYSHPCEGHVGYFLQSSGGFPRCVGITGKCLALSSIGR